MKRWTLRILLCLILGMVTTVGVAWGVSLDTVAGDLAYRSSSQTLLLVGDTPLIVAEGETEVFHFVHALRTDAVVFDALLDKLPQRSREELPAWATPLDEPAIALVETLSVVMIRAHGWPVVALSYDLTVPPPEKDRVTTPVYRNCIDLGARSDAGLTENRALPLRPIFPGILINTLFYAAIWFGLFFAIGRTRRFIRTRRGRCPRCGYNLRGNTPHPQPLSQGERGVGGCPECGWGRR